jgi:hypothetical protein
MATPNVITYAYIRGRWYAFPDSASAYDGVARYDGNTQSLRYSKPVGAIIDEVTLMDSGFWPDTLLDAPGVTGDALVNPPYNPIFNASPIVTKTPDDTTVETKSADTSASTTSNNTVVEKAFSGPDKTVWDFREYVEGNPDLLNAFQAYKRNQDAAKIDSWETHGLLGGAFEGGPTRDQLMGGRNRDPNLEAGYGGGELNVEQWGNIHYNIHGKNENRAISAKKDVAGDNPSYMGRWDDYLVT